MLFALVWLLTLVALGAAVLPLTVRTCSGLPDRGYGLSRVVGLVVVGWLAYLSAILGFTAYVGLTVALIAVVVGVAGWLAWYRETIAALRERLRLIVAEEAVFIVVFGLATLIRAYNSDIVGQEKFMDYAFLNALLRTSTLPAEDMWLSGASMPYYYLGYLLAGLPAKIAMTPGPIAYNLAVVLVFACGFSVAVSIVYALVARRSTGEIAQPVFQPTPFTFAVLGGVLVLVVGNLVGLLEVVAAQGWGSPDLWAVVGVKGLQANASGGLLPTDGSWWWRSSRVIANIQPDGITEFPFFSFLLGDLHPHYVAIPFTLLVVALTLNRWLAEPGPESLPALFLTGFALATLVPASTWDTPAFWGLFVLGAVADGWRRHQCREKLLVDLPRALAPLAIAAIAVFPYFVGYQSQPLGLAFVRDRTPLVSMLILFGPAMLVAAVFGTWIAWRRPPPGGTSSAVVGRALIVLGLIVLGLTAVGQTTMAILLALLVGLGAVGWQSLLGPTAPRNVAPGVAFTWLIATWAVTILVGVELIYLRDVFGSRMNTVFKFQYQAWLLLGLASAAGLGLIWTRSAHQPVWRGLAAATAAVALLPGLIYPLGATYTKSAAFSGAPTLSGDRFLARGAPSDLQAIDWLRTTTAGRPVVVEAAGGDYSEHGRVSTFSGLPTLMGWIGHELQWRGDRPELRTRPEVVDEVYRATNQEDLARLAENYNIRYIFFGTLERAKYGPESQARLDKLLPVAYSRGGTTIYLASAATPVAGNP